MSRENPVRLNKQNAFSANSPSVERSQMIFSFFLFRVGFKSTLDLLFLEFALVNLTSVYKCTWLVQDFVGFISILLL